MPLIRNHQGQNVLLLKFEKVKSVQIEKFEQDKLKFMLSRYETITVFASGVIGKNVNLHPLLYVID